jgi:hypothetical protein
MPAEFGRRLYDDYEHQIKAVSAEVQDRSSERVETGFGAYFEGVIQKMKLAAEAGDVATVRRLETEALSFLQQLRTLARDG